MRVRPPRPFRLPLLALASVPRRLPFLALACALALASVRPLYAQSDEPGNELTVYLVTMGYGDAIWQNFGHNAIRIVDAGTGTDVAYNYGMFAFDEPGFLTRFLRGRMRYWLARFDFLPMVSQYADENRTVWLQELNLTPAERLELQGFLEWNALDENRFYRYDYFRDNCSTRVRDALDRALGGLLRTRMHADTGSLTYRDEALRLTSASIPISTGIDLGLGPAADQPLTHWDEGFIPMRLRDHVRNLTLERPEGGRVPLVRNESVIFQATRPVPPEVLPRRLAGYALAGIASAVLIALIGRRARGSRGAAVLLAVILCVWSLATGLLGVVLAGLWALTDHAITFGNESLLQTNPVALALAVSAPMAALAGRSSRFASSLARILVGLSLVGLLLNVLPWFDQSTGRIIALLLPIHLAVAWTLKPGMTMTTPRVRGGDRAWRAREARAAGRHR